MEFPPALDGEARADALLAEIAQLYRSRLRAHYNDDLSALKEIDDKIHFLRARLQQL